MAQKIKYPRMIIRLLVLLLCIFAIINLVPQKDATPVNNFLNSEGITICAQSGGGSAYPENVASAFTAASYLGIKTFSIGIVLTSDDEIIVADTDDLSVYTGESGTISEFTYAELRNKNFAYNYTPDNGATYPFRGQNILCIRLEAMFQNYFSSNFIINVVQSGEEGTKCATYLCELIRQNNMQGRVIVKGSDEVIDCIRKQTNVTVFSAASNDESKLFTNLARLHLSNLYFNIEFQYIEIDISNIDKYPSYVYSAMRKRKVCLFISGVENTEQYKLAEQIKPDGIITYEPESLLGN